MAQQALDFTIRKFDMKMIQQDSVCIFLGKRRTGKSTLVKDLLYHHRDMPMATVISGTEESNGFFKKIVPPLFIHGEYNPVILERFMKCQRMIMQKIQKGKEAGVQINMDPRTFFIMDDCMYDDSWTHDKNIRYLFMNGRWLKVFLLITMQYPLGIMPSLRTNVDYVFILREPYLSNRKRIYDNYGAAFPSFEFFCQVMDQCTQNYECLVINNTTQSNKLEDIVFWYKADANLPNFRLGSPEIWAQSLQYTKEKDEDEAGGSLDNYGARRLKGPAITIKKV
jgi:hypothetical protein